MIAVAGTHPIPSSGERGAPGARARLIALASFAVAAFVASAPVGLALFGAGALLAAPLARRAGRVRFAAALTGGSFAIAASLNLVLTPGTRTLVALPLGLAVTPEGIETGLRLGLRMSNLTLAGLLVAFSTRSEEAADAVGAALAPAARLLGSAVHTWSFQIQTAIRFVPILASEARRITLAQRLRGLDPGRTPLSRLRALAPLFVPVFVQSVLRADRLARLLAARGYRPGMRVGPAPVRWGAPDTLAVAFGALALLVALVLG